MFFSQASLTIHVYVYKHTHQCKYASTYICTYIYAYVNKIRSYFFNYIYIQFEVMGILITQFIRNSMSGRLFYLVQQFRSAFQVFFLHISILLLLLIGFAINI